MVAFTINSAPYAGNYGGGRHLAVLLYEGNITAGTTMYGHPGELKQKGISFGAEIVKDDLVKLNRFASNKFITGMGKFAVEKADAAGDLAIGRVLYDPIYYGNTVPTTNQTISNTGEWATAVGNGYFRYTTIELFTENPIYPIQCGQAGTGTAIVAGDGVLFDISDDTWVYGYDGDVADSGVWDATADSGQNSTLACFMALNSADTDDEWILAVPMFPPVQAVT